MNFNCKLNYFLNNKKAIIICNNCSQNLVKSLLNVKLIFQLQYKSILNNLDKQLFKHVKKYTKIMFNYIMKKIIKII